MALHNDKGANAEQEARRFLEQQGMRWVTSNYRSPSGEIDLVMTDRDYLVFVEVRYRFNQRFGGAVETVTPPKRRKLIATASHYLQGRNLDSPCRFDIIGLTGQQNNYECQWIKDAFRLDD